MKVREKSGLVGVSVSIRVRFDEWKGENNVRGEGTRGKYFYDTILMPFLKQRSHLASMVRESADRVLLPRVVERLYCRC